MNAAKRAKGADYERGEKGKSAEHERGEKATKGAEREGGPRGGSAAHFSTEQQTKVRSSFRGASITEARDINITHVSVGSSIPRTVVEYWEPVPASIVESCRLGAPTRSCASAATSS